MVLRLKQDESACCFTCCEFRDNGVKAKALAPFSHKSNTILNNPKDNEVKATALTSYCSLESRDGAG